MFMEPVCWLPESVLPVERHAITLFSMNNGLLIRIAFGTGVPTVALISAEVFSPENTPSIPTGFALFADTNELSKTNWSVIISTLK